MMEVLHNACGQLLPARGANTYSMLSREFEGDIGDRNGQADSDHKYPGSTRQDEPGSTQARIWNAACLTIPGNLYIGSRSVQLCAPLDSGQILPSRCSISWQRAEIVT